MQKDAVSVRLTALAFDFFYWFSRFEFALKENKYRENHAEGATALPGWNELIKQWHEGY